MRNIADCALGIFALALGCPIAIGQEKPKVEVVKPVEPQDLRRVQLERAMLMFRIQTADGSVVHLSPEAQPLIRGDLKGTVEEIEKALRTVQGADLAESLRAVDAVQRATMKARRSLRTQKDLKEIPSEDEVRALTQMQFFRAAVRQPDTSPLGKARSAVDQAVVSVRQATNVEEVKKALDEVEESTAVLRALLWEKKPKKD